jgi:hypothetical protein
MDYRFHALVDYLVETKGGTGIFEKKLIPEIRFY